MAAEMTIAEFQAVIDKAAAIIRHSESTIQQCRGDIERSRAGILRLSRGLPRPDIKAFDGTWTLTCPQCGWLKRANIQAGHTGLELAYANHSHSEHAP
jgi:hypothetical protein